MIIFESTFPNDYRKEEIKSLLDFVLTGKFCQLVCVPGAGKATILRLLAHNRNVLRFHLGEKEKSIRLIYLNLLELPSYDEMQIAKFLLLALDEKVSNSADALVLTKHLAKAVNKLADQEQTLVFLFDHFDEYQNKLPRSFFQLIRGLKSVAKYKFAALFASRRDLREIIDPEIFKEYYDFFIGNVIHLKIYNQQATNFLFSQIEQVYKKKLSIKQKKSIIAQTSGHAKLTKVIGELVLQENMPLEKKTLLEKPLVLATLFELWLFLTAQEQQVLRLISQRQSLPTPGVLQDKSLPTDSSELIVEDPRVEIADSATANLVNFDLLRDNSTFTIPLFAEFVKTVIPTVIEEKISERRDTREIMKGESIISDLLSPQEYRLLRFLIENQGRIVERDEIIRSVWPDAQILSGISDEAIDQMIFRLRKKIENEPNKPKHIITIKGRGFRFIG